MGTMEYCTCFNKETQGNETSLTRKVLSNFNLKPDSLIPNEKNPEINRHNINIITKSANSVIDSTRDKQKQLHRGSNMSSIDTDHLLNQNINYANGDNYNGKIINNKREGKGKLIFASGGYYNGEFRNDHYDGYGTLCSKNTIYHGEFSKGERKGKGKSENIQEGTEFLGNWENNKKNGFGKEIYSEGTVFEGNYVDGLKKGKGVIKFPNGLKYSGEFSNDKIEGKGTFAWSNNKVYTGEWKENSLSGFGILDQDKDKHIGYFDQDKKNGLGLNYFKNSKSFLLGKWIDSKLESLAIYYIPNQPLQFWQMENNKLVKYYQSNKEISEIKSSREYTDIKSFFDYLIDNSLINDLTIDNSFAL